MSGERGVHQPSHRLSRQQLTHTGPPLAGLQKVNVWCETSFHVMVSSTPHTLTGARNSIALTLSVAMQVHCNTTANNKLVSVLGVCVHLAYLKALIPYWLKTIIDTKLYTCGLLLTTTEEHKSSWQQNLGAPYINHQCHHLQKKNLQVLPNDHRMILYYHG